MLVENHVVSMMKYLHVINCQFVSLFFHEEAQLEIGST